MREVRSWLEKSRSSLESPTFKKRPIRDQLAAREKMLADVTIQKNKIAVSVEKLQVHFRSGIGGDKTVVGAAKDIIKELDQILDTVKEQVANLEKCISQLDKYQQVNVENFLFFFFLILLLLSVGKIKIFCNFFKIGNTFFETRNCFNGAKT